MHQAELWRAFRAALIRLRRRRVRRHRCGRRVAERAPHALELAAVCIEDRDALIAVAVGDIELVRLRVHEHVCGLVHVDHVGVASALPALADLHHQLSGGGELQDHVVAAARTGRFGPAAIPLIHTKFFASTKMPCSRSGQS
jgi:hypothetical protein